MQNEGTCYAHAVARVTNRILRRVGIRNNSIYDLALAWAVNTYDLNGTNSQYVLEEMISSQSEFIPEDLRPFLAARSVSTLTKNNSASIMRHEGEVLVRFRMQPHQYAHLSRYTGTSGPHPITAKDIPQSEINISHTCYTLVLDEWESGILSLKNFGPNGFFLLHTDVLTRSDLSIEFTELYINNTSNLPTHYSESLAKWKSTHPTIALKRMPRIDHQNLVVDTSQVLGQGRESVVYVGRLRQANDSEDAVVAVKVFLVLESEIPRIESRMFHCDHPNIVQTYGYSIHPVTSSSQLSSYFEVAVAMRLEGGNLADIFRLNQSAPSFPSHQSDLAPWGR